MTGTLHRRRTQPHVEVPAQQLRWAVRVTGSIAPGPRLIGALEVLDSCDPDAVAHSIVEEKVVSLALRTLRDARPELALRVEANEELASHVARLARANDSMEQLVRDIEDASPPASQVALLKGAAARTWYPDPLVRDVGDLDLMVCCAEDAFRLAHALKPLGYEPALWEPPWIKRTYAGTDTYGQINLVAAREAGRLAVDIHFGGYSVRHCGLVPTPDAISDPTFQLACIIANAAGDCRITGKDLNDIFLAMASGSVRLPDLVALLEACKLTRFLSSMVALVLATHDVPDALERDLVQFMSTHPGERPDADQRTFEWQRRWAVTVLHAWKIGARRSPLLACRTSATAALYYSRRLRLRPTRFSGSVRWQEPAPWTCVRLIPLTVQRDRVVVDPGSELGGALRRGAIGNHAVVVTDEQVYAPTVFYGLPADVLAKVRGLKT